MAAEFDWDEGNAEKIARDHDVATDEVEAAFEDPYRLPADAYVGADGRRRRPFIGSTDGGPLLFVVFVQQAGVYRVITAYDADEASRRAYRRNRRRRHR